MIEEILKRDGVKQKFEPYKIEDVIKKAFQSVNVVYSEAIFFNVIEVLNQKKYLQLKIYKILLKN